MDKLIVNAAITGIIPTREQNPNVPISVEQIISEAQRVQDAGASIVHLHARGDQGEPTYKRDIYEQIITGVREKCPDLIISASTSGRVFNTFEARSEVLECRPEMASLTLGSMNFPKQASVNEPQMIQALAQAMAEREIVPELELFDLGMVDYAKYLIHKKFLSPPYYANILLGNLGTLSATALNLSTVVGALPEGTVWAAAGIGRFQFLVNSMAIAIGGHVRVGLEDNMYMDIQKTDLATNVRLIDRLVALSRDIGRQIASPTEARRMIGLSETGG